jgi:hypothetical protein
VCRNDESVSLQDVLQIFRTFLFNKENSLTIICDHCYSGKWVQEAKSSGLNNINLTIISATNKDQIA